MRWPPSRWIGIAAAVQVAGHGAPAGRAPPGAGCARGTPPSPAGSAGGSGSRGGGRSTLGTSPCTHLARALRSRPPGRPPAPPTAAPACTGAAARGTASSRSAISTMRPEVHHRHAVADVAHHRQVVRDEQVGQAQALLQFHQHVDHLRLDRHVQRRHRLVADHQAGLERQRARDADALALAAGELVRIALGHVGQQAHGGQQRGDALAVLGAAGRQAVHRQRLADDVAHLHARVERAVRVLVDHLHAAAEGAAARSCAVMSWPSNTMRPAVTGCMRSTARLVVRLAAAAFADQAQRLAARASVNDTPSTALTTPTVRLNSTPARCTGKWTFRSSTRSSSSPRSPRHWPGVHRAGRRGRCSGAAADARAAAAALSRQAATACAQRGAKAQPGGSAARSGGAPSIGTRRSPAGAVEPRHRGQQAARVGVARARVQRGAPAPARRRGRRTSPPRGRHSAPPRRGRA